MRLLCLALIAGGLSWACQDAAVAASPLSLHECRLEHPLRLASVGARCATVRVPENPAQPDVTVELRVAVVPALNRRAAAPPLFVLAGGPGQAATALYVGLAGAFARINRNHDIVLLDQRGTGDSSPLLCHYPDDWQETAQAMPALRAATTECLKTLGSRVQFYTTTLAVQDLETVRVALGYGPIDLYASSYGTRVAQLYMRRHPQTVHAAILDGVTFPEQVIGPDTPLDGERALQLIVARCQSAPDCAAAFPTLRQDLDGLRDRFGPQSVAVTLADPSTGLPLSVTFNRSLLGAALRFLSYSTAQAALLPALIHQAALGRLAPLAAQTVMMARQVGDQLASGMQNSVICSEDVPFYVSAVTDRGRLELTYQGTDQLDALTEVCKLWPRGPVDAELHLALRSDTPTLLLSGEMDPVTPPADAERAALGLSHHRHLVLSGEGHGQIGTGCVSKLMSQFLDDADPAGLDAACLAQHRPQPFFVGSGGPAP